MLAMAIIVKTNGETINASPELYEVNTTGRKNKVSKKAKMPIRGKAVLIIGLVI
jgi:hypothetical protein